MSALACGDDLTASQSLPMSGGEAGSAGSGGVAGGQAGASPTAGFGSSQAGTAAGGGIGFAGSAGVSGQAAAGAGAGTAAGFASASGSDGGAGTSGATDDADVAGGAGGPGDVSGDYEPCPPVGEVCVLLPLGDSITYGIGYGGGYRVELFRRALADGKSITFAGSQSNGPAMVEGEPFPTSNEGHSGWKIDQLRELFPLPALRDEPHIVLLMIGTNDIAQGDDVANAPERLGSLIDLLTTNAPDALIVVATIVPLSFGASEVQMYNAAIPAVVDARIAAGKHVLLVDQFTGFPLSDLGDGVHPNQQGYERMAGVWYSVISSLLH